MLTESARRVHQLRRQLDEVAPTVRADLVAEVGQARHLGGEVAAEAPVHALDQFLAQTAGKIEVDVGQRGHIVGQEALERQVPLERVNVADPDQIADQQRHGGAASATFRLAPGWR